jgi:hypothetical protein
MISASVGIHRFYAPRHALPCKVTDLVGIFDKTDLASILPK